jgi:enoyl-CoA hydratase/carnithine racemase
MGSGRREGGRGFSEYNPEAGSPWEISHIGKPVVAAVNGAAVGIGVEFVTQSDVRIASTNGRFGWVFTRRGIIADTGAGTYLLPHIVGLSAALKWTMSGRLVGPEEALAAGFIDEVCEPDQLKARAVEIAASLGEAAPLAVRETKRLIYASLGRPATDHVADTTSTLGALFQTEDHKEGIASFVEKRPAVFKGR